MDWGLGAALAEAVGALAVVASLIYLTVQIRQNTGVARATYHIAQSTNYRNIAMAIVENAEVAELWHRGLADPRLLTTVEYQRFMWIMGRRRTYARQRGSCHL